MSQVMLSQKEIDEIIKALTEIDNELNQNIDIPTKEKKYDFKRPDKFSKKDLKVFENIQRNFSRKASNSLFSHLRIMSKITSESQDQFTFKDFLKCLDNPAWLSVFNILYSKENCLLVLDNALTYAIIDRLFGGKADAGILNRTLTEIESAVINKLNKSLIEDFSHSILKSISSMSKDSPAKLLDIVGNPAYINITIPEDTVIVLTFELMISNVEGIMNICLPSSLVREILDQSHKSDNWQNKNTNPVLKGLSKTTIELVAELGAKEVSSREFINYKVGDVIEFEDKKLNAPISLKVGNKNKFTCNLGLMGEKRAVQIDEIIE